MRRRHSILSIAFAASMLSGCLGSFGTPGEPTGSGTGTGTGTGTGDGTGTGTGTGNGNGDTGGGGAAGGGGGGGGGGVMMPPAMTGSLAAKLDKATDTIRLNETKSYMLTLTPSGGLTGGVTIALDTPPAGITAVFTPATVNIADANPVTVKVDLTVDTSLATPTTSASVAIKAVSGSINASASVGVTVPAELLITIASGVAIGSAASPNTTAFSGVSTMNVKYATGMKITFINNDKINHEMHAQGTANGLGIAHEGGPLMANAANVYTQTISGPGTINANDLHCHIHPQMIGPKITFQ
jgi:plastocyanin